MAEQAQGDGPVQKERIILEIIDRTLEDLADWVPAKLMPGVGPQHPDVHQEFRQRLKSYVNDVQKMLARKPYEELQSEYHVGVGSKRNPLARPHGVHFKLYKDLEALRKSCPPWFGSGWSEKEHLLEAEYWCAAKSVSIGEAALMLVGVDPRKANYDALFIGSYGKDERIDEILYFLEDRFELLGKRFGDSENIPVSIELEELVEWARTSGLKHPTQFNELGAIRQRVEGTLGGAEGANEKPLHKSSRDFLGRVLVTVAIDRYDLTAKQNSAKVAKKIKQCGDGLGFSLDEPNLAKLIKLGFDQMDVRITDEMTKMPDEK